MGSYKLAYKPFGERAILVEWPHLIDGGILRDIINFKEKIVKINIESLVELNHTYNSLLIVYSDLIKNFEVEIAHIDKIYRSENKVAKSSIILWRIPVCYDVCFGVDLDYISKENELTKKQIVQLHSKATYIVYFIGFLPGFLYLGGLNEKLHVPRKATPRLQIDRGSVAIGGKQTGVYPAESPGGWNIIGNSPINFFDANKESPCFVKAGDRLVFYPISLKEHKDIKVLVEAKVFQVESEVIYD